MNVAPGFEEAEWYINQRNSSSSLQRNWTRVQQQRWITSLYDKYNGDIEKILSVTNLEKSELEGFIRILKIKDFVRVSFVRDNLTEEEFEKANSYKFPITILERIFNFTDARTKWGIEFDGVDVRITSNEKSFYNLYLELIKRIVNKSHNTINTRINKEDLPGILESLPNVSFEVTDDKETDIASPVIDVNDGKIEAETEIEDKPVETGRNFEHLKKNPDRDRIVLPIYDINTDNYRLSGVFKELKNIPINKYPNTISSSLRVFLDLAVLNYIETENIEPGICSHYKCGLKEVALRKRLEFIKINNATGKIQNIISRLIDPGQEYSLDVLNGYIHSKDSHYTNKKFLNSFWDFLFPLFDFLLDIREKSK